MSTWDDKAISGKDLQEKVVQELASEIKKRGLSEVIAEALVGMAARIESLEAALAERNIGDRTADSVDAQELKVGGVDVVTLGGDYAPKNHASSATTYGRGTSDVYGHVKVSNATLHSDTTGTVGIACGQGHKHDQYLTSHQQVSDYDETLSWGTRSGIAKVGNTIIHVTMPAKPSVIGQTVGANPHTKTLTADELQFFVLELTETDFGSVAWGQIKRCKFSIEHVLVMFEGAALSVPIQMSVSAEYVLSSGVVASDSSYQTTLGIATFMYTMTGFGDELQKITLRFNIPNSPFSVGQKVGIIFDSLLCLQ